MMYYKDDLRAGKEFSNNGSSKRSCPKDSEGTCPRSGWPALWTEWKTRSAPFWRRDDAGCVHCSHPESSHPTHRALCFTLRRRSVAASIQSAASPDAKRPVDAYP
ncbi:unnamed protein product [Ranitomeya imitator]|uniref:Uncharacterized protein n=1 Tax=Ranitomeya imitator TaxID=111125 RepID=A0ABN9LSL5_9NEOB|nr:unnamed protein product [Ranitomeya imitator]